MQARSPSFRLETPGTKWNAQPLKSPSYQIVLGPPGVSASSTLAASNAAPVAAPRKVPTPTRPSHSGHRAGPAAARPKGAINTAPSDRPLPGAVKASAPPSTRLAMPPRIRRTTITVPRIPARHPALPKANSDDPVPAIPLTQWIIRGAATVLMLAMSARVFFTRVGTALFAAVSSTRLFAAAPLFIGCLPLPSRRKRLRQSTESRRK